MTKIRNREKPININLDFGNFNNNEHSDFLESILNQTNNSNTNNINYNELLKNYVENYIFELNDMLGVNFILQESENLEDEVIIKATPKDLKKAILKTCKEYGLLEEIQEELDYLNDINKEHVRLNPNNYIMDNMEKIAIVSINIWMQEVGNVEILNNDEMFNKLTIENINEIEF